MPVVWHLFAQPFDHFTKYILLESKHS